MPKDLLMVRKKPFNHSKLPSNHGHLTSQISRSPSTLSLSKDSFDYKRLPDSQIANKPSIQVLYLPTHSAPRHPSPILLAQNPGTPPPLPRIESRSSTKP